MSELNDYRKMDTARVEALLRIVNTAIFSKEKEQVHVYLVEAMSLSRKINYKAGLANCYLQEGNRRKSLSDYPASINYYDSALAISADTSDRRMKRIRAKALEQEATIFYIRENYYTAIDFYLEALKYLAGDELRSRIRINTFITEVYTILKNLVKAEEFALANFREVKSSSNIADKSNVAFAIIDVYLEKNDAARATAYLDELMPFIPHPTETLVNFGYYAKRGRVEFIKSEFDQAYLNFQKASTYAFDGGHSTSKQHILNYLAKTAIKLRLKTNAKIHAREQLAIVQQTTSKTALVDALTNMADYYLLVSNRENALKYLRRSLVVKDSILLENNVKQLHVLGALYEYGKQKDDINRLRNEKEERELSVKEKSFLNKVYLAAILLILMIGYLVFSGFRKNQKLARQQQDLQQQKIVELQKNEQLNSIEAMLRGQEEERSRVAKDLHDGLGSMLSGTKMSLMNLAQKLALKDDKKILFDKSLHMLDTSIGDLRKVAHNLVPGDLAKFGLQEALRDLCDTTQTSTRINTLYQQLGSNRKLDSMAEMYIYRIVQELVNNAVKHGQPKNLMVQLVIGDEKISITVEDDGKGFDVEKLDDSKGAGQANIRYRVGHFQGTYDVTSSPGTGTSVNIELMV